jgi:hypothetical protein
MTLNETLKQLKTIEPGLQYAYYPNHPEPQFRQSVIIRIPEGRTEKTIADKLYQLLWHELKIPYYWQPRKGCTFCHVVPHFYD